MERVAIPDEHMSMDANTLVAFGKATQRRIEYIVRRAVVLHGEDIIQRAHRWSLGRDQQLTLDIRAHVHKVASYQTPARLTAQIRVSTPIVHY
jgi:hypothetical protein